MLVKVDGVEKKMYNVTTINDPFQKFFFKMIVILK